MTAGRVERDELARFVSGAPDVGREVMDVSVALELRKKGVRSAGFGNVRAQDQWKIRGKSIAGHEDSAIRVGYHRTGFIDALVATVVAAVDDGVDHELLGMIISAE